MFAAVSTKTIKHHKLTHASSFWGYSRLADRSFGRQSFGRQVVWPIGRLADWSLGRQVIWPTGRLADWSFNRQVVWPNGRLADWSFGRLVVWPTGRSTDRSLGRQVVFFERIKMQDE
ncbi:hypothetical protein M513_06249 [Trichuris suis]|uniref:Uncharacterized protein n=1 Tax=Trichuris suis TaxID=68888 RepID=A0A085M6U3_9BILA|nr:hypothetical protein M513_06249 [Trichuris suis]